MRAGACWRAAASRRVIDHTQGTCLPLWWGLPDRAVHPFLSALLAEVPPSRGLPAMQQTALMAPCCPMARPVAPAAGPSQRGRPAASQAALEHQAPAPRATRSRAAAAAAAAAAPTRAASIDVSSLGARDLRGTVVVTGAGPAGLAAALALHKAGLPVVVLEREAQLSAAGTALGLWTNAWRALDALGVGDALRQQHPEVQE